MSTEFETRVGSGIDVHPFVEHDAGKPETLHHMTLCGVRIPYEKKLAGHSDADAGLHALVDAMLGTIGAGDIGQHFDNADPQWAGADSSRFVLYAYKMLKEKGGDIVNIDLTIVAQKPAINPHRKAMQHHIASLLKLEEGRVNIKATTTEHLGFLGRTEGLMAQAVIAVKFPV